MEHRSQLVESSQMLKEVHLYKNETLLGKLQVKYPDFPWLFCEFEATEAFKEFEPLFDEELCLLENDDMDRWGQTYDKIIALGLHLIDIESGNDIGEFLLHVHEKEAWFRY